MSKPPTEPAGVEVSTTAPFPWKGFLAVALIYLLSVSGRLGVVDQGIMFSQTRAFLEGHLSISGAGFDHYTPAGVGGLHYSQYGPLLPVLWVPSTLIIRAVAGFLPGFPLKMMEEFAASFINVPASLGILAYLVQAWRRQGVPSSLMRLGMIGVGLSSLLWAYAKMPFSDPWMALGLFAAFCHWRRRSEATFHPLLAGAWLGVALLARKQAQMLIPLLGLAFAWEVRRDGWRDLLRVAAGALPFVALQGLYNFGRFGNPLVEIYFGVDPVPLFEVSRILPNFVRVFVDTQNGFIPFNLFDLLIAFLSLRGWVRRDPVGVVLSLVLLLASAAFLSRYSFWNGGLCFGSRYLVFMIPFLALALPQLPPLTPALRVVLGGVVVLGVMVQIVGIAVDPLAVAWRNRYVDTQTHSTIRLYAGEVGRVLGWPQAPLPAEARETPYAVHPAFQVPDVWWAHVAVELRDRHRPHRAATAIPITESVR